MVSEMVQTNRRRLGLTQEELARKSGVSVRTVRDLESGRIQRPRPVTLRRLADAFALREAARDRFFEHAVIGPDAAGDADFGRPQGAASVSILTAPMVHQMSAAQSAAQVQSAAQARPVAAVQSAESGQRAAAIQHVACQGRYAEPLQTAVQLRPVDVSRRLSVPSTAVVAAGGVLMLAVGSATIAYWNLVDRSKPASYVAPMGDVVGAWRGSFESNSARHGSVELLVNDGAMTATTTYPDLGCVGWAGIAALGPDSLKYREHITSGSCTPDGFITLRRRSDGRMDLTYGAQSGTESASAVLDRVRAAGTR